MIAFNDILVAAGFDPKYVVLMRHRVKGAQIHDLWRVDRSLVEGYQCRQNAQCFGTGGSKATHVACFLAGRGGKTVFGGMYEVGEFALADADDIDPVTGDINSGDRVIWDLVRDEAWRGYEDRLVIDWGKGFLSWKQWAHRAAPKLVVEITDQHETPFPGWRDFRCEADDLALLPNGWRGALAASRGVYLLVDLDNHGKHYIGSAKGAENLLGRLQGYADGGTNGNKGLTKGHRYQVSVLEVVGTGESDLTIEKIENQWKDKLRTREYGLNEN
ncbi:MAG: GIY-YIG nuclease family protein [Mycobacteriales bacterium]